MTISKSWLLLGSLTSLFFITLLFSYDPVHNGKLLGKIGSGIESDIKMSPVLSPGDMVTPLVTTKNKVTERTVTNVTIPSPVPAQALGSGLMAPPTTQESLNHDSSRVTPIPTSLAPALSPSPSTSTATMTPSSVPSTVTIVINEIAWMGTTSSANDEWIELYNPGSQEVDLTGWTLKAQDGTPNIMLSGAIPLHGFYLLERTAEDVISDLPSNKIYSGALSNDHEFLELRDPSGHLIDSLDAASGWPGGDNPSGNPVARASMERVNPGLPGTNLTNWKSNTGAARNGHDSKGNSVGGTPGKSNSVGSF